MWDLMSEEVQRKPELTVFFNFFSQFENRSPTSPSSWRAGPDHVHPDYPHANHTRQIDGPFNISVLFADEGDAFTYRIVTETVDAETTITLGGDEMKVKYRKGGKAELLASEASLQAALN